MKTQNIPSVWLASDPRSPKQGVYYGRGKEPMTLSEKLGWTVIGIVLAVWFSAVFWAVTKFLEAISG